MTDAVLMSYTKVKRESMAEVSRALFVEKPKAKPVKAASLTRALRDCLMTDPSKLERIATALVEVSGDKGHPNQIQAARIVFDRLDGPVKQQVQIAWDKATEGITLHLPKRKPPVALSSGPTMPPKGTD